MAETSTFIMTQFFTTSIAQQIDEISCLIEQYPDNAQYYAKRAYLYYQQNDFNLATKDCQHAIRLDSTNQHYKQLWNQIILKSINYFSTLQTYKMQITYLIN